MRANFLIASLVVAALMPGCKQAEESTAKPANGSMTQTIPAAAAPQVPTINPAPTKATLVAEAIEAGCATCIYNMKGVSGCKLAVKIDGKPYLVTGSQIDDHGDAHAEDGLCLVAKTGKATGSIVGDRFVAETIKLDP